MNLCKVNGKVPGERDKVNKQHDQVQQNLSNARMCLFLLSFPDQSWGFGIKTFPGPSQVGTSFSQQECLGLERIGISPIID